MHTLPFEMEFVVPANVKKIQGDGSLNKLSYHSQLRGLSLRARLSTPRPPRVPPGRPRGNKTRTRVEPDPIRPDGHGGLSACRHQPVGGMQEGRIQICHRDCHGSRG